MSDDIYKDMSDFGLYELFYETGTELGGFLYAMERRMRNAGDVEAAERFKAEDLRMMDDRDDMDRADRDRQIELIERWNVRRRELEALL